ncbi:MAG: rhomboid family intramembrane serine protease [Deltaproteobacteria bacterium]|nr:rhomboid family intramembrane serine protease [Deltaproteobacteria bacterium]
MLFPKFQGFVRTFVFICVGVFILQQFALRGPFGGQVYALELTRFFGLVPELFFQGMIYQPFTWIFLHGNFSHLLFNMFAFWMFGSLLEETWGTRRFIRFVVVTGYLTGVVVCLWGLLDPITFSLPTIGASGVIFAILMAISRLFPDQTVLLFFVFPIKMRYFAYLMIAIEFFALYDSNHHGISNIAHLSGAFVGYFYVSIQKNSRGGRGSDQDGGWFKNFRDRLHQRRMRKKLRVIYVDQSKRVH